MVVKRCGERLTNESSLVLWKELQSGPGPAETETA